MPNTNLNDDSKHWLRREKFKLFTAREFMREPAQARNAVGVYVILLRNADKILTRARLQVGNSLAQWSVLDHQHVYTGLSAAMRSRVLLHLCGTVWDSGVRENLLTLQHSDEILWPGRAMDLAVWENQLSEWLVENAIVGFQINDQPHLTERKLIERLPSPFNTEGNKDNAVVSALMERRERFRCHLKGMGQVRQRVEARSASQWLVDAAATHLAGWQSKHLTYPLS